MSRNLAFNLVLSLVLLTGCKHHDTDTEPLPVESAAYYWRTTWRMDSVETDFLHKYDIHRVFCRYFDVMMADNGQPMPNATIRFEDSLTAEIEFVPTVYITEDCMSLAPKGGWPKLAKKIVDRIVQMNDTHDLPTARELQIDCDYTLRSRHAYYDFLAEVRQEASRHGMHLSTTIRLHQLSMPVPPADYGVLMLYNTGDPQKFTERNPILDIRDAQPYMRYLADYPLPMAAAYPVYSWQRDINGVRIVHTVEASEILRVKKMVEETRADMSNTILIYSLDKENINRYKHDTFRDIFHHHNE